jgi:predicted hydrocarbon binding protein
VKQSHKWIKALTESLDTQLDEKAREKILENCGRNCISSSFVARGKALKKSAKNTDDFLDKLSQKWKHLQRDGNNIYVVYEKCYCPLVKDYPDKLSPTFCNCSKGWIKELFESALEKPITVKLEKSIKQGDKICRFSVHL